MPHEDDVFLAEYLQIPIHIFDIFILIFVLDLMYDIKCTFVFAQICGFRLLLNVLSRQYWPVWVGNQIRQTAFSTSFFYQPSQENKYSFLFSFHPSHLWVTAKKWCQHVYTRFRALHPAKIVALSCFAEHCNLHIFAKRI